MGDGTINGGYGWPTEPCLPSPGEVVELPDAGVAQAGPHDGWVVPLYQLTPSGEPEQVGDLRYGQTGDGLYWRRDGGETDHWAMVIVRQGPRGFRRWQLCRE
jgi:hypothetical protein